MLPRSTLLVIVIATGCIQWKLPSTTEAGPDADADVHVDADIHVDAADADIHVDADTDADVDVDADDSGPDSSEADCESCPPPADFHTIGGEVAIEAENYSSTDENWESLTRLGGEYYPSTSSLFHGDGYMRTEVEAMCGGGPWCGQLDFRINFNEAGFYYVHLRTASWAPDYNSVKIAVDGEEAYSHIYTGGAEQDGVFTYMTGSEPIMFFISTPGMHTVSIGARRPYVCLDRVWFSQGFDECDPAPDVESPDPMDFLGP